MTCRSPRSTRSSPSSHRTPSARQARSSYDDYFALNNHVDSFEWLGIARESQATVVVSDRTSIMSVAALTPDLAAALELAVSEGAVISHRVWLMTFAAKADVHAERMRIDGVDMAVAGVAPDWLEGVYLGRAVDIWMPFRETSLQPIDRTSRSFWALGRLRAGVSPDRAQAAINATRGSGDLINVLPYSGMTPEVAGGMSRIGTLLGVAAGAVFFIACANVASFLLARAAARARETSVRVALGASRGQLARQLLSDSVLISMTGGALGLVLAMWTADIVPALFFDQDAEHLVFAPDLAGIVAASAVCGVITIACGLVPFFEIRHDRPATVLQRESAGPSITMRRVRAGLVVAQMTCCCVLVISTGLLLQGFRTALHTSAGHRLGQPILATLQARPGSISPSETSSLGLTYFREAEQSVQSLPDISATAWVATLPGSRPSWRFLRIEPQPGSFRDITIDVAAFTSHSLKVVRMPPIAGRMFGGQDRPSACKVVLLNQKAAIELFDGDAVGRTIEDPAGERVEVIGVVAMQPAGTAAAPNRATIYYYADQTGPPLDRIGPARVRVPAGPPAASVAIGANIVSSGYFSAMGLSRMAGRIFPDDAGRGCRVGVVNQEAADLYFGGNAVGAAVIDTAGRRTEIVGVVQSDLLRTFQRAVEPAIYFPMAQDYLPRMTLILGAREAKDVLLTAVRRRLQGVPGGVMLPVVVTLETHLSRNSLAPLRIATTLVGASAATAITLGVLGLYGAMSDVARQRRREIAVRIALGAQGWRVIRQVLVEGVRLAGAGTVAGMLGSLVVAGWLAGITASGDPPAVWVWLTAPIVLLGVVVMASVLPARRALSVDPLTIMRDN